jgi:branched-chain amino acid transport system permease protein
MALGAPELVQSIANGILQGGFLALAAAGLSLVFGVQKVLNIAHGSFIVLAAYLSIQFSILVSPALHLDPLYSIPLDVVAMAALGWVVYRAIISRIETKGFESPLLATFGLSVLMVYTIQNGLGPIPSVDPSHGVVAEAQNQAYSVTSVQVGSVLLRQADLIALGAALVMIPALQFFLSRTYYGKALRATSLDWESAEFSGIDTRRVRMFSFVLGAATAGVAGGILAVETPVTPGYGSAVLLPLILIVVIIGGVGSMLGTLAAGLTVGVVTNVLSLAALSFPTQYALHAGLGGLVTFLLFIVVLMVKPTGLFGKGLAGAP